MVNKIFMINICNFFLIDLSIFLSVHFVGLFTILCISNSTLTINEIMNLFVRVIFYAELPLLPFTL
ncbi:hypothetical protein GLOIN_2v1600241 [Rhizophagus irregularis DAOM 181602=DAOM 197198]|uniref:Uncharacterized protein n=1 Tax=Rhizophagus irregularis (strain DAOM 181602 / DAOM 197198 / MUCL 43194) TaxID=747089 RepID=A0A2P4Q347_RHIID|nr:hypothetical protein GLOIN_2v1600241 [Rhizophagus irregularis DAOM 181602=DAOM 197198]POG72083.1 hypothetical protein GLOIN_2v1600241 [Rhizophagus irregularis DAOM 181602=DAOM 197198]|eukprot:XP_025178949.1 hypothetical protein GLOIN_2v1600241 [Rhizophagus irregularis DAOM 181602=DAOM 197198]